MATTDPISMTSLAMCRWEWCKESFSTQDELVEHVLEEHVEKAVPIKKKDLPLEKRAKIGTSFEDSISTTYLANQVMLLDEDNKDNIRRSISRVSASEVRLSTPSRNGVSVTPLRGVTSPSPQLNRFRALSEASSPARSPDPSAMHIDRSPSTAELIANILNSGNPNRATLSPAHVPSAGPSRQGNIVPLSLGEKRDKAVDGASPRQRLPIMRTGGKPPSPQKNPRLQVHIPVQTPLTRVLSATAEAKRVVVKSEDGSQDTGLVLRSGSSEQGPEPQVQLLQPSPMEGNSINSANLSQEASSSQSLEAGQETSAKQQRSQTPPRSAALPAHGRPFRSGMLELNILQSESLTETMRSEHGGSYQGMTQENHLHMSSEVGLSQDLQLPQASPSIYVPEEDMLHSSLEPSIPAFTQAPGGLDSQWQLQTQAPYSFDSQLDLDSQSHSPWLSHEPLSSGLGDS